MNKFAGLIAAAGGKPEVRTRLRGRFGGDKVKQVLGWVPTTTFEDGMRSYVDWYRAETEAAREQVSEA